MTSFIPLFSAQCANAGLDLLAPVSRVIDSHWYVLGNEVKEFEREFAAYCGASICCSVANGTDALELGLRALGVEAGDKVILAANAGFYGSTAVHLIGAVPLYVDGDPRRLTLSTESLSLALKTELPKAIIVTHLYGQMADIEAITALAAEAGVPVIEDCAQAHGAARGGKRAGSYGTIGCFSFYPTKNLGALGDGGAVITSNDSIAARLGQLRQYGWGEKYRVDLKGGRNSRLDEMQAAILREKLPHLDRWNAARREIARQYNQAFAGFPMQCPMSLDEDYVAHLYVVRTENREALRDFLKQQDIATDVHYPIPDHMQAPYTSTQTQGALPATERACDTAISLPCFPGMSSEEVKRVIQAVTQYFQGVTI
ncbi:MAG: DegT/DnrJ/EryC1/StrS family aminotransferase [Thiobacillus sp.]|nr:DegT/DnrJ/EryC1/StrS family aminotransferase [Thiobacillus sp.]